MIIWRGGHIEPLNSVLRVTSNNEPFLSTRSVGHFRMLIGYFWPRVGLNMEDNFLEVLEVTTQLHKSLSVSYIKCELV